MQKQPVTTEEFFNIIKNILREKNKLPDILDCGLATLKPIPIRTYEFDMRSDLSCGGNEGICLALWIEYCANGEKCENEIGIFRTLYRDDNAMHVMAALLADFIIEGYAYVSANLDDFTWEGVDIYPFSEKGERLKWGYSCGSLKAALRRKDELLRKNYPKVVLRDNATRTARIFSR